MHFVEVFVRGWRTSLLCEELGNIREAGVQAYCQGVSPQIEGLCPKTQSLVPIICENQHCDYQCSFTSCSRGSDA